MTHDRDGLQGCDALSRETVGSTSYAHGKGGLRNGKDLPLTGVWAVVITQEWDNELERTELAAAGR